jgi:putative copper resistance protein D
LDDALIVIRGIHFAATIMVAGTIFFQVLVAEPAFRMATVATATVDAIRARQTWLVWIALAVAIPSGAAWVIAVAASITGRTLIEALTTDTAWTVLTETQFGNVAIARLVLAILLAAILLATLRAPKDGTILLLWRWLPASLAACLLGALAWTGHSGATPGQAGDLQLAADAVHLIGAGAWVGGLFPLAMLFASARGASDQGGAGLATAAARRFSVLGIISVAALLTTGIVNTWVLVGSVPALIETDYGRLLLLKIVLFAAMVSLAAVNRFHLLPRLGDLDRVRQIQRNSLLEAGLGLMVIEIVGALGTIPPALHQHMHHMH